MNFKTLLIGGCPRSGTGAMRRLLTLDGRALITGEEGLTAWKGKLKNVDQSKLIYVGDKMPEVYLQNVSSLYNRFPDAKFIFTNRSGYDVVASYVRRPLRKKSYKKIQTNSLIKKIKFGEKVWKRNYTKIKNLPNVLPKDSYILLKYEDNISDIGGLLSKLGNFLNYNSPVSNLMRKKGTQNYVPYYRPIHANWSDDIPFWKDTILDTVSNQFKNLCEEYINELFNA